MLNCKLVVRHECPVHQHSFWHKWPCARPEYSHCWRFRYRRIDFLRCDVSGAVDHRPQHASVSDSLCVGVRKLEASRDWRAVISFIGSAERGACLGPCNRCMDEQKVYAEHSVRESSACPCLRSVTIWGGFDQCLHVCSGDVVGASIGNNRVYVAGGSGVPKTTASATFEVYNVMTDSWATKTSSPVAAYQSSFSRLGSMLHMIGGRDPSVITPVTPIALDTNQAYSPTTDTWRTANSMPTVRYGHAVETDGSTYLYAIGGSDPKWVPNDLSEVEVYISTSDTWQSRNALPTARKFVVGSYYSGYIYATGGYTTTPLTIVEAYSVLADSWITIAGIPTGRSKLGSTTMQGVLYTFGGLVPPTYPAWTGFVEKYTSSLSTISPTATPTLAPTAMPSTATPRYPILRGPS